MSKFWNTGEKEQIPDDSRKQTRGNIQREKNQNVFKFLKSTVERYKANGVIPPNF